MVPHPSSAMPKDTFIARGRHLTGSLVKKTTVKRGNGIVGKAGQHFHATQNCKNILLKE